LEPYPRKEGITSEDVVDLADKKTYLKTDNKKPQYLALSCDRRRTLGHPSRVYM